MLKQHWNFADKNAKTHLATAMTSSRSYQSFFFNSTNDAIHNAIGVASIKWL
jgi:hypothetical protein